MKTLKEFVNLQEDIKPYKLVLFQNTNEEVRDVSNTNDKSDLWKIFTDSAKKSGVEVHRVDFNGLRIERKGGKTTIHSFGFNENDKVQLPDAKNEDEPNVLKPIEINPEDTIIFPRGLGSIGLTNVPHWTDMIEELELEGYLTIPSLENWTNCSSKFLTDILCRRAGLRTPKTLPVTYSDDSPRVAKEFNFPVILKASTGSQTGVGVLIMESLRSLHSTTQMLKLYDPTLSLLVQEFIETKYDVRVIVVDGKVMGAMKREVIQGSDFRSNVSLGAGSTSFELTEIEKQDSIKAANAVGGRFVGVDFIPAKDREKEQPYILEVNSMPGLGGIEKIKKGMTYEILEHLKDRSIWSVSTP